MKCSDIPDKDILEILYETHGYIPGQGWASHCWGKLGEYFKQFPAKFGLAKMRQLHRRGLVGGCPCGCRGDWEITDKGLELLGKPRLRVYSGYGEIKK
jgi:hypothetical protein